MPVAPSLSGYFERIVEFRQEMGSPITFRVPVEQAWPEGTKINPDTGLPYDATIRPTSADFTDVVKTCLVILKQASPLRPQSDTHFEPVGDMSGMDIIIDIDATDKPDVEDATEMIVNGLTYHIEEFKPFALAGTAYRWLIYGEEQ